MFSHSILVLLDHKIVIYCKLKYWFKFSKYVKKKKVTYICNVVPCVKIQEDKQKNLMDCSTILERGIKIKKQEWMLIRDKRIYNLVIIGFNVQHGYGEIYITSNNQKTSIFRGSNVRNVLKQAKKESCFL
jgi:hypothetical protein